MVPKPVRNYMYHHKGTIHSGPRGLQRSFGRPAPGWAFVWAPGSRGGRPESARCGWGVRISAMVASAALAGYRHRASGVLRRTGEPPAPTTPHCPLVATSVDTNQVDGTASVMCAAASRVHLAAGEMPLPSALRGPGGSWQKISCIFFLLFLLFPLWYTWLSTQYVSWL